MPDAATIQRPTLTNGAGGQTAGAPTTTTASVRIGRMGDSPAEAEIAERLGTTGLVKLAFPLTTDVKATDTVLVGSRTFEVVAPLPLGTYSVDLQVVAKEIF